MTEAGYWARKLHEWFVADRQEARRPSSRSGSPSIKKRVIWQEGFIIGVMPKNSPHAYAHEGLKRIALTEFTEK